MKLTYKPAFFTLLLFITSYSHGAITPDEAKQLGENLTPLGAERAGNKAGTIPEWTGGITKPIDGYKIGDHHPDPYSDDNALFTINAANVDQYKNNLSPGQIALFNKYPNTWTMNVYPTRRSAAYPESVYQATIENATKAELISDGNGFQGARVGTPFPIPKSGVEVIWNHIVRYRGNSLKRMVGQATPTRNGNYTFIKFEEWFQLLYSQSAYSEEELGNKLFYFKQTVLSPARLAGNVLMVHETRNQVKEPRLAWIYNAGQRRVRRAPQVAYDGPGTASDGLRTSDNFDVYNGAPDRYDWELIGKKEMYIPYNSYQLHSDKLKYDDIIQPGHINSDYARYELHRVWHVRATLKSGKRHIYATRDFYVDEDSWQVAVVDHYDGRGELWRVGEAHSINYYEVPTFWTTLEVLYDLQAGRYLALGLNNEDSMPKFNVDFSDSEFTPAALRRSGRR